MLSEVFFIIIEIRDNYIMLKTAKIKQILITNWRELEVIALLNTMLHSEIIQSGLRLLLQKEILIGADLSDHYFRTMQCLYVRI